MKTTPPPQISVLMPVYNCEHYLADAIESVLSQTYQNFELLIIDDGSSDSSLKIIEKYANSNSKIRYWSRENHGLVETINELVCKAKGHYIARMDGDDLSHPARLQLQLQKILSDSKIILVGCWITLFGERSEVWHYRRTDSESKVISLFGRCCLTHASFFAKKSLFSDYPFKKQYTHLEDLDFLNRIIRHESGKIVSVPESLYRYRIHPESVCALYKKTQNELRLKLLEEHLSYFQVNLVARQLELYYLFCQNVQVDDIARLKKLLLFVIEKTQSHFDDNFFEFELRWRAYLQKFNIPYHPLDPNIKLKVTLL